MISGGKMMKKFVAEHTEAMLETLKELCAIPAPSHKEEKRAAYCKAWLENIALAEALGRLGERERKIIDMRFYKNKTQMEIADEIGISQAQVSRLEKGVMQKIKEVL